MESTGSTGVKKSWRVCVALLGTCVIMMVTLLLGGTASAAGEESYYISGYCHWDPDVYTYTSTRHYLPKGYTVWASISNSATAGLLLRVVNYYTGETLPDYFWGPPYFPNPPDPGYSMALCDSPPTNIYYRLKYRMCWWGNDRWWEGHAITWEQME